DDVPAAPEVTASDNCDGDVAVVPSEEQSNPGSSCNNTITRTWVATDDCGNENTCTQIITVNDNTDPELEEGPDDASYQCYDDVPAQGDLTATDNCDDD